MQDIQSVNKRGEKKELLLEPVPDSHFSYGVAISGRSRLPGPLHRWVQNSIVTPLLKRMAPPQLYHCKSMRSKICLYHKCHKRNWWYWTDHHLVRSILSNRVVLNHWKQPKSVSNASRPLASMKPSKQISVRNFPVLALKIITLVLASSKRDCS